MSETNLPDFFTRLFAFYKLESGEFHFPKFRQKSVTGEMPVFVPTQPDRNTLNSLKVLHPQARKFLAAEKPDSIHLFQLAPPLQDELSRAFWRVEAPHWVLPHLQSVLISEPEKFVFTIRITNIRAIIFPTRILVLLLDLAPAFSLKDETATLAGKMLLNTLYRYKKSETATQQNEVPLVRFFADERQQKSVANRLGGNDSLAFVQGLAGASLTPGELANSLAGNGCFSLMNTRFVTQSFVKTSWTGTGTPFSDADYIDLIRLARAENDRYLPNPNATQEQGEIISHTFENVVFGLAGEGIACWIKPKTDQEFLQHQFRQRFDTIYLNLFLLALHQRFALVDLSVQLDKAMPPSDVITSLVNLSQKAAITELDLISQHLRQIRTQIAGFYLRAFFYQPATLSNHQQFYRNLQKLLGISDLLTEVQQSNRELEYIINDLQQRKTEALREQEDDQRQRQNLSLLREIGTLIKEQQRSSHNELILTLVVEGVAIPYYLYSFLDHALHLPPMISVGLALVTTVVTIGYTIFRFRRMSRH